MNIFEKIIEHKKKEVLRLKNKYSISSFEEAELFNKNHFSLIDNIKKEKNISIIAELKKQSPSKGIINKEFDYQNIIDTYFNSNIAGVSVLTDELFFGGNINLLKSAALNKRRPLLRKDFIIDTLQVYQTKASGGDVILLICEALSADQITELTCAAHEINLEVLLELHSKDEINKIDFKLNKLIGINNRNLDDFSVDLNSTIAVSQLIPEDVLIISESGIGKEEDLVKLKKTNVKGILVGEYLMSSNELKKDLTNLEKWCRIES